MIRGVHHRLQGSVTLRGIGHLHLLSSSASRATSERLSRRTSDESRAQSSWVCEAKHRVQIYSQLSKYRLSALVMMTTSAGYFAAGGPVDVLPLASACLGTMLTSSSANTFNQIIEKNNDSQMKRTRSRPLPSGRISQSHALGWGAVSGTMGIAVLAAGASPLTAALGAANLLLYVGPYTLSKTRSELNTWIGSVVGAVPPLMGWAAATDGQVAVEPVLLAAYLFIWQFPHFFSLAWLHRDDYARGGFRMVPCADPSGHRTARLVIQYSTYLMPIPLIAAALDATSWMFAVEGTALNAYLLYRAYQFGQDQSKSNARDVFKVSLWHLPAVLALFVFHSRRWTQSEDERESSALSVLVQRMRARLKGACIHEIIQKEDAAAFCPAVVAGEAGERAKLSATPAQDKDSTAA